MKIIVPMAGIGSRLRPHTLTIPKPLTLIAGKPIVQRLVEDIVKVVDQKVEEIAFVIGPSFPKDTESKLLQIAKDLGAKSRRPGPWPSSAPMKPRGRSFLLRLLPFPQSLALLQ